MEFWITIVGLARSKRVIIPALLVALSLGAAAYLGTPVTYSSSTTMVLTTTEYGGTESQDPTQPGSLTNPMLNFNDSLRTTSAILIEAMNTKDVAASLGVGGPTRLFINDGRTNPDLLGLNGPFLYIVGQSTSAEDAHAIVLRAKQLMSQKLRAWQSALNAPQKTYVSLVDVVPPSAAEPARSAKLGVMAFLAGFLLSMGIAYFGHQVRTRRRARAAAVAAQAPVAPARPLADRVDRPDPAHERVRGRARRTSRSPVLVPDDEADDAEPDVVPALKKIRSRTP